MLPQVVVQRLEGLEQRVTALELLPARIDDLTQQIVQLRTEMHGEFSETRSEFLDVHARIDGVRLELHALHDETRVDLRALSHELRAEMHALNDETRAEIRTLHSSIQQEFHRVTADTLNQMRILHEDLVDRIAVLDEAPRRRSGRKRTKKP